MTIRDEHHILLIISFQQFLSILTFTLIAAFLLSYSLIKPFPYKMVRFDPKNKKKQKKSFNPIIVIVQDILILYTNYRFYNINTRPVLLPHNRYFTGSRQKFSFYLFAFFSVS
ncbi:hypothetical protein EYC80_001693 [Monilinia laxa]|uniref:Uncharacterized protein n=1 Tax=Monilinia laxa TaxID=61186 RepID=A0A5N6K5Q7_MONLA|nr:hypothetical protein EYC80_001693 [Monilinia laxa]